MTLSMERSNTKWIVLVFSLFAMVFCLGFNTTSLAILLPSWSESMGWTTSHYALVAGAVAMGTVWTAWLAGILLEKFNPKWLMFGAILLNGLAMAGRGLISSFSVAYVVLFISGISAALINPGCLKTANAWFDRSFTYRVNGILISGGAIGYFIGFNATIPLSKALGGWDNLFLVVGLAIIAFGIVWAILIPAKDEAHGAMNIDMNIDVEGYTTSRKIKECIKSKQIVLAFFSEFFIAGAILSFSSMGPAAFLGIWEGINAEKAGLIISMSNIGSTIGYYVLPFIADKLGIRKPFAVCAQIWSLTLYALSPFTGNVLASCIMINLAGFGNGFGLIGGRTLMMEHPDCAGVKAGTAAGLLIEFNKIGCVVFPLIYAALFASFGVQVAWTGMFAVGAVGTIIILFMQDTGKRARAKREAQNS